MKYTIMAEVVDSTSVWTVDDTGEYVEFVYPIDTEPYITSYGVFSGGMPVDWFDTMEDAEKYIEELKGGK